MRLFKILSVVFNLGLAHAAELTDATGTRVAVVDRPNRVVTLAPSLSELAAEVLEQDLDRIIGVSEYTDFPPVLKTKTSIGPYHQFNLEKVASLKPDLVLATEDGNSKDQVTHLRELGLPVVVVRTESLAQIEESIGLVALSLGRKERGEQIVQQLRRGIKNFRDRAKGRSSKRVLLQLGDKPLIVVGKRSFLNEAVELIGGRNAYGDTEGRYPRPALEDVVRRDPDVVVILSLDENLSPFQVMVQAWASFPKMKAVKTKSVRVIRADGILRPSLRLLEGLSILERAVYPESKP